MSIIDFVFVIIVCFFCLYGVFRGLIRELAGVLGIISGFILFKFYYIDIMIYASSFFTGVWVIPVVYTVIVVSIFIVSIVMRILLQFLTNFLGMGIVGRLCGGIFGWMKGYAMCMLVSILLTSYAWQYQFVNDSLLIPHFLLAIEYFFSVVSFSELYMIEEDSYALVNSFVTV